MALTKEEKLQKKKEYYYANKEIVLERNRKYYLSHIEQIRARRKKYHREYYLKNRERVIERTSRYNKDNKERAAMWARNRRKRADSWIKTRANEDRYRIRKMSEDVCFRLNWCMSRAVRQALKGNKRGKSVQTVLGYSMGELKEHLQRMFTNKMSWDNYGSYWHIDHIIPKSWFVYSSMEDEEFSMCWNYTNLQPMRAEDNQRKSNRYIG